MSFLVGLTDTDSNNIPDHVDIPNAGSSSSTQSSLHKLNETIQKVCNYSNCNDSKSYDYDKYANSDSEAMEQIVNIVSILVPTLFGIIVAVGLLGNSLVVVVVSCNSKMRSTTNILIINLAVADLLFIIFCVPFTAWDYAFPYWPFGDIWCKAVQYLVIVCAYASIYTLVLMSLDRFLAVVHPITSMSIRTEKNAYIAIGLLWCLIFLSCIPVSQSHGELPFTINGNHYSTCGFLSSKGYNLAAFHICFFLSSYVVPLALIFCLYMLMLKRLWFGSSPGGHVSAESLRSKKRVTRMVVVVVVIFAVCWFPIQIVLVLKSIDAYEITPFRLMVQITSHTLAYMNSCVNPILYAFLSDNFRKAFHKVISCNSPCNRLLLCESFKNSSSHTKVPNSAV